ncbi:MAG: 3'-5' exonuclease, partial [Pontimonas sp.]
LVRRAQAHDEPTMPSVTLATVHAAKGQEWPVVCVVGLSEGQFPISYANTADTIAEEQRLFYVAITRAKEQLALSWAKRNRSHGGAERQMSRFLKPLGIHP